MSLMQSPFFVHHRPTWRLSVLAVGIACVMGSAHSQTAPSPNAAPLPESVRIAVRGKVGDVIVIKSQSEKTSHGVFGTGANEKVEDETGRQRQSETKRVLSVLTGKLILERQETLNDETKTADGHTTSVPHPLRTARITYAANGAQMAQTMIATIPAKSTSKTGGKQAPAAKTEPFDPNDILFPDQLLHVGDTWKGRFPMKSIPKEALPTYTATLAAIERHLNVPCAKVVLAMDYDMQADDLLGSTKPKTVTAITGTAKISGALTLWFTLDRGLKVEDSGELNMEVDAVMTIKPTENDDPVEMPIKMTNHIKGSDMITKMPVYDPTLVVTK